MLIANSSIRLRQQIQHPCPINAGALSLDERLIVLGLSLTLQARAVG